MSSKVLSNQQFQLLEKLYQLTDTQLLYTLPAILKNKGYKNIQQTTDYITAEGDIPIALIAHLDTVNRFSVDEVFYDRRKNVIWAHGGETADCRAGVYAILHIIQKGLRPHVIFTMGEERGGVGARKLASCPCPFADLHYGIEIDRQGHLEAVFYQQHNKDLEDYIQSFGFTKHIGSYTDIVDLSSAWNVGMVNVSAGFEEEHTESEILRVDSLNATIDRVVEMLTQETIPVFKYIEDPDYYVNWGKAWGIDYNTAYGYDMITCSKCGQQFMEEEIFPILQQNKLTKFYCPDCMVDMDPHFCPQCGQAYEPYSPEQPEDALCPICVDEKRGLYIDKQ